MKFKEFLLAALLTTIATILCWLGCAKVTTKDEPKKTLKVVFIQEHSMVDYSKADKYVNEKINAKKKKIAEYEKQQAEIREQARIEYEEYLAELERQRRIARANQIAASEPTYMEPESNPVSSGYLGSYKCTGYVATGNACANGNMPTSGYTIASNSLPMGTRVYIEGIGERVVEDTGGMPNNVIDVFVDSTSEAYALTGNYEVYIIDE